MWIKDQTACFVQSDLDLHCLQKQVNLVPALWGLNLDQSKVLSFGKGLNLNFWKYENYFADDNLLLNVWFKSRWQSVILQLVQVLAAARLSEAVQLITKTGFLSQKKKKEFAARKSA